MASDADVSNIIERLEKLEKQMGQVSPNSRILDAEGLIIRDANGKVRATLTVTETGSRLDLCDVNGKPRAVLQVTEAGPAIDFFDANG